MVEKKETKAFQNFLQRKNPLARLDRNKKASIVACKLKSNGSFLDFLKSIEVGGREKARERELEWQQKSDQAAKQLHEG